MRTLGVVLRAGVTVLLSLVSGCASVGNVQRADTVGKGNVQASIEPGVQAVGAGGTFVPYPHLDGSVRYGVTESIDLGLRAGWSFLEAQAKFLLTKPGDPKLAVSIAPTFGGIALGLGSASIGSLHFAAPVLIGIKFGANELVLGPRLQGYYVFAGSSSTSGGGVLVLGPGATVGVALGLGDRVTLMPEIGFAVPLIGSVSSIGGATTGGTGLGGFLGQFKLGIMFGKQRGPIEEQPVEEPPQEQPRRYVPPPPDGSQPNNPPPPPPAVMPPPAFPQQ
ncbi:MAG: hypothetical protein JNM69_38150 [Archangium sp.]|nr:hypothetical protein [Archangium sp.]